MLKDQVRDFADRDKLPNITSITLGGFQVFDQPTTIPFGHLTFLFGPNSSGKSAVEDGLRMLQRMLKHSEGNSRFVIQSVLALVGPSYSDELDRHWRRTDGGDESYAPRLTLGLTATPRVAFVACLESALSAACADDDNPLVFEIGAQFKFHRDNESASHFSLTINETEIILLLDGVGLGVNFSHPILRGFTTECNFSDLEKKHSEFMKFIDGWVWLTTPRAHLMFFSAAGIDPTGITEALRADLEAKRGIRRVEVDEMLIAVNEVFTYFNEIVALALTEINFSPTVVPASRIVPTATDLTFACRGLSYLTANANPVFGNLADSCLAALTDETDSDGKSSRSQKLFHEVNLALSDHLFVERGYAVSADIHWLISHDEYRDIDPDSGERAPFPALVELLLTDCSGRRYSFEEVGSGLGYVLPVLCCIYDHARSDSIALIQQPELHLHPALQASLADVFISAIKPEHQIILETHSEHLLLRALRRIRQTTQGKAPPGLRLSSGDVVVVYFEPSSEGITTVRHLRISEDGEFLDRWPRGFFTERDAELFDE